MNTKQTLRPGNSRSQRVMFTLPRPLAAEVEAYAAVLRNGNKSGFVADAIRSYIEYFRKCRHTQLLRNSYAASAAKSRAVNREWEPLDDETWIRLDQIDTPPKSAR
jgi:metal-responsive CopG/Arc/MetJ family transcriptional regulator